ncbi:glycosyltransferase [Acinetobacter radioresistens]|jgi:glycosyltransferase involved in cell wall biosynthesis|uniref:glycosyltransferase n=1 Tax=Acinetobacter radioresistens TaxID=40216 RepID=UPI0001BBB356|nr:glycosyltransferase [Acinetobacter radioresistens]EEY85585.1 glycosyltransferase, group 1 family protein [Acinetobacter radioresistens SH164]MCK4108265.1 glycosyltransferase [Acinetobacter radioresistens]
MKKVVHIIIGLNVGGAELMLKRLVLYSQKKGNFHHEVISLTDLGLIGKDLKEAGICVYTLNMSSALSIFSIYFSLRKLLKKIKPDIVQTWMYHSDLIGGLAAKSVGINNIIWGVRNTELDSNSGIIKKIIRKTCALLSYKVPKKIICVASKAKNVHENIGYCKEKMLVIPNGFDLNRFNVNNELRYRYRDELRIQHDKLVIGNIGRFTPAKNQVNFIKACLLLLEKGYDFDVIIAGRNISLNNLEIKKLVGDKENFKLVGEIDQPESFYNAIDVFCLSSITEGFPNVLGEAMATKKICLTTDAGDAREILGNCGYHINGFIYDEIAKSIEINILSKEHYNLKTIGERARLEIVKKYSLEKIVSDFEKLY